jgi:hypothetical protein
MGSGGPGVRVDDVENTFDGLLRGAQDPATSPISQRGAVAVAVAVWKFSSLSRFVTRDLDKRNRDLGPPHLQHLSI